MLPKIQKKWKTECIYFFLEPTPYNTAPSEYKRPPIITSNAPLTPMLLIKGFIKNNAPQPLTKWHTTSSFWFLSTLIAEKVIPRTVKKALIPK